ncbi:MAG: glycerophosphodiester phosphodiesterase [Candidatus Thorarchaeota archaeon]
MTSEIIFDIGRPLIMAHRGNPTAAPENTILAMEKAIEVGIDLLETDVRMTRDDELVLFHDDTLERTTGSKGAITDYTLDELLEIDAGAYFTTDGGETFPFRGMGLKIVTLRAAFDRFPEIRFNLDIKDTAPKAPSLLADIIREYDREDSVIVGSFHSPQIKRFRQLMPAVATAASSDEVTRFVLAAKTRIGRLAGPIRYRAFQVPISHGRLKVVTRRFVQLAHKRSVAVHVWTINDRMTMEYLIHLGVDGIFTDAPSLLRQVMKDMDLL